MAEETKSEPPTIPATSRSKGWRYNLTSATAEIGPDGRPYTESGGYCPVHYCKPSNGDWVPAMQISGLVTNALEQKAVDDFIEYWREIDGSIAGGGEDINHETGGEPAPFTVTFQLTSPLYTAIIATQTQT